jgi:DNA-binding IclR family transcriptional regulator
MSEKPLELEAQAVETGTRPPGRAASTKSLQSLTLKKGLQVLSLFDVEHPDWFFTDLWRRAGVSRPTAYRLVKTLEDVGYLSYDPRTAKYHLGTSMLKATYLILSHTELARIARPYMATLAKETTETVVLSVWTGEGSVIADRVTTSRPFKPENTVGTFMPSLANVHSRIFLAFGPPATREAALGKAQERRTEHTLTDRLKLAGEFARIKRDGVAYGIEEWNLGMCAVAAPVFDSGAEVRATIAVIAPTERFGAEERARYGAAVKAAALAMSRQLGYRPSNMAE